MSTKFTSREGRESFAKTRAGSALEAFTPFNEQFVGFAASNGLRRESGLDSALHIDFEERSAAKILGLVDAGGRFQGGFAKFFFDDSFEKVREARFFPFRGEAFRVPGPRFI